MRPLHSHVIARHEDNISPKISQFGKNASLRTNGNPSQGHAGWVPINQRPKFIHFDVAEW